MLMKSEFNARVSREVMRIPGGGTGYEGVVGNDVHAQGGAHSRKLGANSAKSDDACGAPFHLDAAHGNVRLDRILPLTGGDVSVRLWYSASEREHETKRVFGHGAGVSPRGIHHYDSVSRGGLHVNVVGRSTTYTDELESGSVVECFFKHKFGFHDQNRDAGLTDTSRQFFRVGQLSGIHPTFILDGCRGAQPVELNGIERRQYQGPQFGQSSPMANRVWASRYKNHESDFLAVPACEADFAISNMRTGLPMAYAEDRIMRLASG